MFMEVTLVFAGLCALPFVIAGLMFLLGADKSTLIFFILLVLAAVVGVYILTIYVAHDIWRLVYKDFGKTGDGTADRIEGALGKADVAYSRLGPRDIGKFFIKGRIEDEFELVPDGLSIMVLGEDEKTVYIGPVEKGTRNKVERLKGLVDGALG